MVSRILTAACVCGLIFGAAHAADPTTGKPQYGAWGFDQAGGDASVKPGNDFFRYANGTWLDHTPIPADKPAVSLRLAMTDLTEQRLHDLMEAAAKGKASDTAIAGKVGAFYQSFMDQARIDALGAKPIAPQLDAVKQAATRDGQAALMGRTNTDFEGSLFNISIDVDLKDIKHYAVYVSQAGLGMPDRDYYLKPEFAKQKAAYQAYVTQLLTLIGWPQPESAAKDVVAFETAMAQASISKVEQRDPVAMYNPMSVDELKKLAPGFAWNDFLSSAQLGQATHVVVMEKTAFPKLAALYAKTPVATIQAWQAARVADNAAYYLSEPFQQAYFEMHDKTLAGQQQMEVRWKRGVHAVSGGDCSVGERLSCFGNLGWAVGQLYTDNYFPASSKVKIEELVANLKAAYRVRIQKLDWMGPETRKEALKKLDTYTIKVGYPDHPRDYANVTIHSDDLAGNVLRAAQADWAFYVNRLDKPVDRSDWSMTPQTNDAYNGSLRDIVFPAAILQPPIISTPTI